jgi:hypothetical protein
MGRRSFAMLVVAVAVAVALAGCGSSVSSGASNPLKAELSYLPGGSSFVMTIATDPSSPAVTGVNDLIGRFPLAGFGIQAAQAKLTQYGIDYSSEIKPLLGNPIAISLGTSLPTSTSTTPAVLAVWATKSESTLRSLIKKALPGVSSVGTRDGATLYQAGPVEFAIDGATLVVGTAGDVPAALDRHAHGGGFPSAELATDTAGLPQNALIEAFGSLTTALSQPSAASARRIPWVAAIRGYGAALSVSSSGISINYRVDTPNSGLTATQLPIAPGSTAPRAAGSAPIVAAIHDPAQIFTFIESAAQTINSPGYRSLLGHLAQLKSKTGADLAGIPNLLTGDMSIESDTHTTMVRATTTDPSKLAQTLADLTRAPRSLLRHRVTSASNGFYAINEGSFTISLGLVGDQFVAGRATQAQLRAFAAAPTSPLPGAQGSVAFKIALVDLLRLTLHSAPPTIVQTILNSLGDITGWASDSPSGLTGSATLAIK